MEKQFDYGSYAGYRDTVQTLNKNLRSLLGLSEEIALVNTANSIRETIETSESDHFEVAIVGEFKRGKSTLINALLGKELARFTASSGYMLNCGMGTLALTAAGVLLLVKGRALIALLAEIAPCSAPGESGPRPTTER